MITRRCHRGVIWHDRLYHVARNNIAVRWRGDFALPLRIDVPGELLFFGEIVIGVSLLAQMFQSRALHTLKAGMVSALIRYGALLTGTISAFFLLGENACSTELAGGLLLAISVGLTLVPDGRLSWAQSKLQPQLHPDSPATLNISRNRLEGKMNWHLLSLHGRDRSRMTGHRAYRCLQAKSRREQSSIILGHCFCAQQKNIAALMVLR